jgi:hypothetical protein
LSLVMKNRWMGRVGTKKRHKKKAQGGVYYGTHTLGIDRVSRILVYCSKGVTNRLRKEVVLGEASLRHAKARSQKPFHSGFRGGEIRIRIPDQISVIQ